MQKKFLHFIHVLRSPAAKRLQSAGKGLAEWREGILYFWWNLLEVLSIDDPVRFQLLKLLYQHLVTDTSDGPPQIAIAPGFVGQVEQDQGLPLSTNDSERGVQSAIKCVVVIFLILQRYLPKSAYWKKEKQVPSWRRSSFFGDRDG